jgi:hypothetical protein
MRPMIVGCVVAVITLSAAGQADDIRQLVAERQFGPAMQRITAGLALKGAAGKAVDRYALFMLKGECHLQMKALAQANDAYANAAKEPAATEAERAIALAHVSLLKASKAFAYTPKRMTATEGHPSPIDILDKENRKRAFLAMMTDEQAASEVKFKAARAGKSLPPIAETFKPLAVMEGYERAATGEAAKVKELRVELLEKSKKVLADALRDMSKRVGDVGKDANTFVETVVEVYGRSPQGFPTTRKERAYKKKGLSEAQTDLLKEATTTCDKLALALPEVAKGLAVEETEFDSFADEARRVRKEVDRILDTDYLKTYRELPK